MFKKHIHGHGGFHATDWRARMLCEVEDVIDGAWQVQLVCRLCSTARGPCRQARRSEPQWLIRVSVFVEVQVPTRSISTTDFKYMFFAAVYFDIIVVHDALQQAKAELDNPRPH